MSWLWLSFAVPARFLFYFLSSLSPLDVEMVRKGALS